jgi:hypothetical protein
VPKLTDEELIAQAKVLHRESSDASIGWRRESVNLYDMVAGRQWDAADEAKLREQLRPAVTFNVMSKFVDAVCGLQIANRMDVRFVPRQMGAVKQNEILSSAGDWARDTAGALAEESEAFRDMLITGMGATEMFIDQVDDPEGTLCIERRDPLEIFIDPTARRRGGLDARYIQRVRLMPESEIEERWPDAELIAYAQESSAYSVKKLVPVMEYQYWEVDNSYSVDAQLNGRIINRRVTPKQWKNLEEVLDSNKIRYQAKKF